MGFGAGKVSSRFGSTSREQARQGRPVEQGIGAGRLAHSGLAFTRRRGDQGAFERVEAALAAAAQ